MDKSRFGESSLGQLTPVQLLGKDWAFIPDPLPPTWRFPERLWPLLAEAVGAVKELDGTGRSLLPNPELLLHPLQTREAITSSSLEGTYVTPEQYLLFQLPSDEPEHVSNELADWREVDNYGKALRKGIELLDELPLCSRLIKEMHEVLVTGARGESRTPGEFRTGQVQIGPTARYVPPPARLIEAHMENLEKYMNETREDPFCHPLVRCYIVHYQLEAIHPFNDGNGRIGRALFALMIYKWMELYMPWLYMSAFFERYKKDYIDNLFNISTVADWESWIAFCLHGTIAQSKDAVLRCQTFKNLKEAFHKRIDSADASARTHKIIEGLFTRPIVIMPDLQRRFNISQPTARADVKRLIRAKILVEVEDRKPKVFYSPEIINAAYRDSVNSEPPDNP